MEVDDNLEQVGAAATPSPPPPPRKTLLIVGLFLLPGIIFGFLGLKFYTQNPPVNFPVGAVVEVPYGSTVQTVADILAEKGVVRSSLAFFVYFNLFYDQSTIKASTYTFTTPLNLRGVADFLVLGNYSEGLLSLTHREGERASTLAKSAAAILTNFDPVVFLTLAEPLEGKLYPETYFIPSTFTEEELLELLLDTFDEKTAPLKPEIVESSLSEEEIIILASILEREANDDASRKMVSGILQNRLAIGMPLQADASVEYILDKTLAELTPEDLKIDSPYNTYTNVGLPPTPIGNPGLEAIEAVLHPTPSDYLFYITGNDGQFYYAKDFDQHRVNISRYLR